MDLKGLFSPKSIAIVGASAEDGTVGNVIAKNILNLGYSGEVYLVNPKHAEVLGKKCYPSLFEIASFIDLAIFAIPAKFVAGEIEKNADKIKNFVIISAGFSEIGEEGKEREKIIKKIADEKKLNILGPNCLGFIIPKLKLNASFAGGMPKEGNIAFVTQSGALAVGIMDIAEKEDVRFSSIISIGNKMDLDEAEVLDYLANDESTKVIGMYLEGIKSGEKFIRNAIKASHKKPIVILKSGKTEKSQKAISSHTGALAGTDEIISSVFEKCGIIRTENLEEFFCVLNLISQTEAPSNESVAVITNAGGPGVLTTDAFFGKIVKLIEISEKTRGKLKEFLPVESSLENPIDILGDAHEDRYEKALKAVDKNENAGSIVVVLTPQDQTPVEKIAKKIINFKKKTKRNISTVFIGGKRVEKAIKKLRENNIPNFKYPDQVINVLNYYYQWSISKKEINFENSKKINDERKERVARIIEKAKSDGRNALFFQESKEIMEMYGINLTEFWEYNKNLDVSFIKFPVAAKVDSDKVLHKTDKKGLILGIKNKEELEKSMEEMRGNFKEEKIILQPMLPIQTELILGMKRDSVFGPVIVYGLGGIYTEIFKIVNFIMPPAEKNEIEDALLFSKLKFLFSETRGQSPFNLEELARIIYGIMCFALENPEVVGLDINPLLVYNNGNDAVAVDVKILV
jgi:acetate---CoA ligase (ADP-forming)